MRKYGILANKMRIYLKKSLERVQYYYFYFSGKISIRWLGLRLTWGRAQQIFSFLVGSAVRNLIYRHGIHFTKIKNGFMKTIFYFLGEVRMFHPARKVCFHEWRPVDKKNIAVNSIVFHSEVITNYS